MVHPLLFDFMATVWPLGWDGAPKDFMGGMDRNVLNTLHCKYKVRWRRVHLEIPCISECSYRKVWYAILDVEIAAVSDL